MRRVNTSEPDFTYDPDDPEGFRSGMFRPGRSFGATRTGATVYDLPPGQAVCPYHYEHGEEEWVMCLSGTATVRTPDGLRPLAPFEVMFFPTGPEGAHQIRNDTDAPVRVLMLSTLIAPDIVEYLDTGKIGARSVAGERIIFARPGPELEYWEGED